MLHCIKMIIKLWQVNPQTPSFAGYYVGGPYMNNICTGEGERDRQTQREHEEDQDIEKEFTIKTYKDAISSLEDAQNFQ